MDRVRILGLLRYLEYIDTNEYIRDKKVCPWCGAPQFLKHESYCELAAILNMLEG